MKSRNFILIVLLVVIPVIGLTTLPDGIFDENQPMAVNEFSSDTRTTPIVNQPMPVSDFLSDAKTITVGIVDGIGSRDTG